MQASAPRKADRFDLPPPDGGAAPPLAGDRRASSPSTTGAGRTRNDKPVRKAVFPVAGLGTRLLPATKAMPKEMLTIVDRPLIQYAVDEAREAGIEQMIFVTGRGKARSVDYFDIGVRARGDDGASRQEPRRARRRRAAGFGEIVSVRQQQPLGLGHAVWCARHIVGDEPFAVLLPDDLMVGKPGAWRRWSRPMPSSAAISSAPQEVPADETAQLWHHHAGRARGALTEVRGLVEKPRAGGRAVTTWCCVGRYILQPEVMDVLEHRANAAPAARSS